MEMEVEISNLPVIDWELSIKLAGNKKEVAKDMLDLLMQSLPGDMDLINQLYVSQRYKEFHQQVHRLHGAICYFGTPRLKRIILHLETNLKNNIMESLSSLLDQLNTEVNHLLEHHSLLHT